MVALYIILPPYMVIKHPLATSESLFRSVFVRELLLKGDAKCGLPIRDYAKPSTKCSPGVSAPYCCFHRLLTFLFLVFISRHLPYFILFFDGHTKLQPLLAGSPSILGYLTLLLPPTFVKFLHAKQSPRAHSSSPHDDYY